MFENAAESMRMAPGGGMADDLKVLIVDDSKLVITQLERILASVDGVDLVGKATDGAAAVRTTAFTKPDLVLMDIVMPGMDGLSALRMIGATRPKTRVVMISSVARKGTNGEEAFRLGAVQMIQKPFDPEQIQALLESELELHKSERGDGE
jgi:CheY-like chemotaxis protein